jgi:hypothetical protein
MDESLGGCAALMHELRQLQDGGTPTSELVGGELAERHSDQLTVLGMHPTHESQMARRLPELLGRGPWLSHKAMNTVHCEIVS